MRTRKVRPYINKYFCWGGQIRNVRIGTFSNKKQMAEFIKQGGGY